MCVCVCVGGSVCICVCGVCVCVSVSVSVDGGVGCRCGNSTGEIRAGYVSISTELEQTVFERSVFCSSSVHLCATTANA